MSHIVQWLRQEWWAITLTPTERNGIADHIEELERENAALLAANRDSKAHFDQMYEDLKKTEREKAELLRVLSDIVFASQDLNSTREGIGLYASAIIAKHGGQHG